MMRAIQSMGVVGLLLGLAASARADETTGTIKTVDTGRREVVLKGLVKDTVYELNKDATVWLDGARCKLSDLTAEDRAAVVFEKKGEHLMASSVRGLRKAHETTGTVSDILGEKHEITLKGTIKNATYELTKGGTVWIDSKLGTLKDIRQGDQVLITYEQRGDRTMATDVTLLKRK